jgi:hypothetical protein
MTLERACREALGEVGDLFHTKTSPEGWLKRRLRIETYSPSDIRALPPYLSVTSCEEVNAACDRWLASRGKLTGKNYAKFINKTHHDI